MNSFLFATQFIPVEALSLLAALEDADLMACNAVLSALARSGQWQRACEMLRMGWGDFDSDVKFGNLGCFFQIRDFVLEKTDGKNGYSKSMISQDEREKATVTVVGQPALDFPSHQVAPG